MTKKPEGADGKPIDDSDSSDGGIGHNLTQIKDVVLKARDDIDKIMKRREKSTDELNLVKDRCEEVGISRKVLMRAYRDWKADPEKRNEEETAYAIAREAMGVPVQEELFGKRP